MTTVQITPLEGVTFSSNMLHFRYGNILHTGGVVGSTPTASTNLPATFGRWKNVPLGSVDPMEWCDFVAPPDPQPPGDDVTTIDDAKACPAVSTPEQRSQLARQRQARTVARRILNAGLSLDEATTLIAEIGNAADNALRAANSTNRTLLAHTADYDALKGQLDKVRIELESPGLWEDRVTRALAAVVDREKEAGRG